MNANEYKLIQKCIEDGVECGYRRAYKHTDSPNEEHIIDNIVTAVMLEISEWFNFEETSDGN